MVNRTPPGRPGIPPRWTSSAKSGVGTALSPTSRVWFTLSHGIVNEVYYPRIDQACIRDLGLIVTNGTDFFSEEKRDSEHKISYLDESAPAFRLTNTCRQGRYRIHKELFTDPRHDTLVQRVEFSALRGKTSDYQLYVLLAPHLGNQGGGNTAWIDEYEGSVMLFAQRGSQALALASSVPWLRSSAGFVGVSDGWQDLNTHKRLTWLYSRAEDGNTALTGEIDLNDTDTFILALGFGSTPTEAARQAHISLASNIDEILASYQSGWRGWQETQHIPENPVSGVHELGRISSIVLRSHESKLFPGAIVASLSIPWGFSKGDNDLGGYHIVWPRDLVEAAGGLLAVGARQDARRVLSYLKSTQEQDGHWAQNMWLDGTPYWHGIQMDETAFPIMLVDLAHRHKALKEDEIAELWPMVRRAVSYLVCNGPVTQQDRWEEDPGYSPFTLAVEIAALLVAADLAETNGEPEAAAYLRYTADVWNANIEKWTYVSETDLAQK
ncbi:MAG: glycoside hydrolase family 15 protein, partial [Candidatus Promineifilaceae bacterium]